MPYPSNFENNLQTIASIDVKTLVKKDAEYGSSWKKRGGVGAFMMLARKWDRLETQVTRPGLDSKYDIFDAIQQDIDNPLVVERDSRPGSVVPNESVLETIRDLRRYLLLVESEIVARKQVDRGGTPPTIPPEGGPMPADMDYARPYSSPLDGPRGAKGF